MSLIINADHYEQANSFRVSDVMFALYSRPERLYPRKKFEPDPGIIYDMPPPEQRPQVATIEEALAAVRKWCQ